MNIRNLKIGVRLAVGFATILILMLIIGVIAERGAGLINESADRLYQKELLGLSHMKEANINLIYMQRAMRNIMLAQTDSRIDEAEYKKLLVKFTANTKAEID
jgi:methyl-accepting chemotaxis protein